MDGLYEEFRLIAAIQLYGWGTATLGEVSSTASNVITLKDDVLPATWFYVNQLIDSYTADGGGSIHDSGLAVTAVNLTARTVTTSTQTTTAANDVVTISGAGGSTTIAPMGLFGNVDSH